jgi:hypothetical protein
VLPSLFPLRAWVSLRHVHRPLVLRWSWDQRDPASPCTNVYFLEQLLHELESKYLSLKSDFSIAESARQALAADKKAARTC